MKTGKLVSLILVGVAIILLVAYGLMRFVFLSPLVYGNNSALSPKENRQIKEVLLSEVKERGPTFCFINADFMDSVKMTGENTYEGHIQTWLMEKVSEDCVYYFTVENVDGAYTVTSLLLDP